MNVLVFASLTPPATANYLISALRDLGHDLFVCSDVDSPLANLQMRGAIDAAQLCASQGLVPDLLLFVEGGTMRIFPVGLEHIPCLTAWYGIDTHMDYVKHLRVGRLFDITFIAHKEYVERLREDGLTQAHWLPVAFAPELHPTQHLERHLDIAYVGSSSASVNPIRHALLVALRREFPLHYFGLATPAEMGKVYASAKLVFNRSVNNDVNMRFFEATGAGAVLVSNPIIGNGVDELLREGEHYFVYRDETALLVLIRKLLQDPERCRLVGEAARLHVLNHHTYIHRAGNLVGVARQAHKGARPSAVDYLPALLSMVLLGAALRSVGRALSSTSGGKVTRIMGKVSGAIVLALAAGLSLFERFLDAVRRA